MPAFESRSDASEASVQAAEYTRRTSPGHRERSLHVAGRRLRFAYFGAAGLWGFIVGAAGVCAALQSEGLMQIPSGSSLSTYGLVGTLVAVGGGAVIAGAYQEAKRRR